MSARATPYVIYLNQFDCMNERLLTNSFQEPFVKSKSIWFHDRMALREQVPKTVCCRTGVCPTFMVWPRAPPCVKSQSICSTRVWPRSFSLQLHNTTVRKCLWTLYTGSSRCFLNERLIHIGLVHLGEVKLTDSVTIWTRCNEELSHNNFEIFWFLYRN